MGLGVDHCILPLLAERVRTVKEHKTNGLTEGSFVNGWEGWLNYSLPWEGVSTWSLWSLQTLLDLQLKRWCSYPVPGGSGWCGHPPAASFPCSEVAKWAWEKKFYRSAVLVPLTTIHDTEDSSLKEIQISWGEFCQTSVIRIPLLTWVCLALSDPARSTMNKRPSLTSSPIPLMADFRTLTCQENTALQQQLMAWKNYELKVHFNHQLMIQNIWCHPSRTIRETPEGGISPFTKPCVTVLTNVMLYDQPLKFWFIFCITF